MNINKSIKKLDKLKAKRAKMEYNLAAIKGFIIEVQEKINDERESLQVKLDFIEASVPATPTLTESMRGIKLPDNTEGKAIIRKIDAEQKLDAISYNKSKSK